VPRIMQSNRKTIGIRIPVHWFCEMLIQELGEPIVTTSIPVGKQGFHVDPLEIEDQLGHMVDLIIDSGILPDEPSTVISLESGAIEILRQGRGEINFI